MGKPLGIKTNTYTFMSEVEEVEDCVSSIFSEHGIYAEVSLLSIDMETHHDTTIINYEYDIWMQHKLDAFNMELIMSQVKDTITSHINPPSDVDLNFIFNMRG